MSRKHEARSLILRGVCLDGGIHSNALHLPGEGGYHDEPLRPARLRVDCHRRLFGTTLGERTPNAPTTRPHSTYTTPPRTRTTRTTRTTQPPDPGPPPSRRQQRQGHRRKLYSLLGEKHYAARSAPLGYG